MAGTCATLLAAGSLGGCVERRLTIGSNPPGTLVMLNDQEIGRTPVTVPFTWDGDYDLRFRYEVNVGTPEKPEIKRYYLHTHKRTETPWFEYIPMDLFAELLPVKFKDEQVWGFVVPEVSEPTDVEQIKKADADLIQRAQELKGRLNTTRPALK